MQKLKMSCIRHKILLWVKVLSFDFLGCFGRAIRLKVRLKDSLKYWPWKSQVEINLCYIFRSVWKLNSAKCFQVRHQVLRVKFVLAFLIFTLLSLDFSNENRLLFCFLVSRTFQICNNFGIKKPRSQNCGKILRYYFDWIFNLVQIVLKIRF